MTNVQRRLIPGVFLVAAAMLLLEVALTRVLSFTIWYHFAYVVISLALLGFGAAGAWLAARPSFGREGPVETFALCAIAGGVSTAVLVVFIGLVPLDPMKLTEDSATIGILCAYVLFGMAPFLFAGLAISLALREAADYVHRLYFWDLVGGGLACALAVPLMNVATPPATVMLAAAIFGLGAFSASAATASRSRAIALVAITVVAVPFVHRLPFPVAHSKQLAKISLRNMTPVYQTWSALFRTDAVKRTARTHFQRTEEWGLSSVAAWPIQQPWGFMLHDGTAGAPVYDLREGKLDYLDDHILRMPYLVTAERPRVLVIGVGGGRDVLVANRFGASHVTGVELDASTVHLIRDELSDLHEGRLSPPGTELVAAEGRNFIGRSQDRYDLVQLTGVDTLSATASGAYVLAENYLYTVEAMNSYLDHLAPGGIVSFATGLWDLEHPRSAARMLNVARSALLSRGVDRPWEHVTAIHSNLLVASILVKNEPFTDAQRQALLGETKRLAFTPLAVGAVGHPTWLALAGPDSPARDEALSTSRYEITAVTDDNPFFFHFFRWADLMTTTELGPTHTTALAQIVLALLAIVLSIASVVLVLGPLVLFRGTAALAHGKGTMPILAYFLSIGLGFMLLEVSLMQKLVLYLGYPTYALSVVLFSLLTFLGVGAYVSTRWAGNERTVLPAAWGVLGALAAFYVLGFPTIQNATLGSALGVRVIICVLVLAPLGLLLGMFLPIGVRRAAAVHRDLVPWAWAVNGSASVTAAVLAVVLAMTFGFTVVWILSLAIYGFGILMLLAAPAPSSP